MDSGPKTKKFIFYIKLKSDIFWYVSSSEKLYCSTWATTQLLKQIWLKPVFKKSGIFQWTKNLIYFSEQVTFRHNTLLTWGQWSNKQIWLKPVFKKSGIFQWSKNLIYFSVQVTFRHNTLLTLGQWSNNWWVNIYATFNFPNLRRVRILRCSGINFE